MIPYPDELENPDWFWNILMVVYMNLIYVVLYLPPPFGVAWWAALLGYKEWVYDIFIPNPDDLPQKVRSIYKTYFDPYEHNQKKLAEALERERLQQIERERQEAEEEFQRYLRFMGL